ncbi:MAG: TonB-dependent receptor [Saprospiraceae bacterium]|nr:TonB-dependent receptor [Saprospiraceae bacterium]
MRYCIILIILLTTLQIHSQVLRGTVKNDKGEKLEGAVIFVQGGSQAAVSEKGGSFELKGLSPGSFQVSCSYLGYETVVLPLIWPEESNLDFVLSGYIYHLDEVEIKSNIHKITPFNGGSEVEKEELKVINHGQDVPVLLQWQPSVTINTDAGAGVGYTGMRIRGVEQSRINVTINDIPINDAESQGVFWVDLPDIASSAESIRIQRGVGPSTNGAGAYGGTVSVNTFGLDVNPSASANISYGSFNTRKMTFGLNSGLMNNRFNVDARYSIIKSNGYIDRASSDLKSWYIEGARVGSTSSLRLLAFSGTENTYQAWNGVPEARVNGDQAALNQHYFNNVGGLYNTTQDSVNLFNSGRRYNYFLYDNQVDNYTQTHVQLHYAKTWAANWKSKLALHYTKGSGYFEQYKYQDELSNYLIQPIALGNDTLSSSDIIRRRWLDNDFFGGIFKVEKEWNASSLLSIGGGYHIYKGGHFGDVIEVVSAPDFEKEDPYYESKATKSDGNIYLRFEQKIKSGWSWSADAQVRNVNYSSKGNDNDLRAIDFDVNYLFFNPKLSINKAIDEKNQFNLSFAVAHREPDRSDFTDHGDQPLPSPEKLLDTEISWKHHSADWNLEANTFLMSYKNQLVPTGQVNDVGNTLRKNIDKSYRRGLELVGRYLLNNKLQLGANLTLSQNKIKSFTETIYDYSNGREAINIDHGTTDIALSPNLTASCMVSYQNEKGLILSWSTRLIGKQYLDNTSSDNRSIPSFSTSHINFSYPLLTKFAKELQIQIQLNNLFNQKYSSGGYSYTYIYNKQITENFLYPQAGFHGMAGVSIKL